MVNLLRRNDAPLRLNLMTFYFQALLIPLCFTDGEQDEQDGNTEF
jgi:hypothetical protein